MKKTLAAIVAAAALAVIPATSASAATPTALEKCVASTSTSAKYGKTCTEDTAYVVGLYDTLLNRDVKPNDSGVQYWVGRLQSGDSRENIVRTITRSPEYAQLFVELEYAQDLGRETDRGAQYWVDGIRGGMAPEWVAQNVLASPEFAKQEGAKRVDSWYEVVLGREGSNPANAGEEDYWNGRIKAVGSLAALREIWYSPEGVVNRLQGNFDGILDRPAESYEVNYFYSPEVTSDIETQISLLSTPEYYDAAVKANTSAVVS